MPIIALIVLAFTLFALAARLLFFGAAVAWTAFPYLIRFEAVVLGIVVGYTASSAYSEKAGFIIGLIVFAIVLMIQLFTQRFWLWASTATFFWSLIIAYLVLDYYHAQGDGIYQLRAVGAFIAAFIIVLAFHVEARVKVQATLGEDEPTKVARVSHSQQVVKRESASNDVEDNEWIDRSELVDTYFEPEDPGTYLAHLQLWLRDIHTQIADEIDRNGPRSPRLVNPGNPRSTLTWEQHEVEGALNDIFERRSKNSTK